MGYPNAFKCLTKSNDNPNRHTLPDFDLRGGKEERLGGFGYTHSQTKVPSQPTSRLSLMDIRRGVVLYMLACKAVMVRGILRLLERRWAWVSVSYASDL
eukprot:224511-Amorphochlora_amoeboformis.AAC.1